MSGEPPSIDAMSWPDGSGWMNGRLFRQLDADGHVKRDGDRAVVRVAQIDPYATGPIEGYYEAWQEGDDFMRDRWTLRALTHPR